MTIEDRLDRIENELTEIKKLLESTRYPIPYIPPYVIPEPMVGYPPWVTYKIATTGGTEGKPE